MKLLKLQTVRQKLLSIALLTTLVALVIALAAVMLFNLRSYHTGLMADMTTQSQLLGHMTVPALTFDDRQLAMQNLSLLKLRPRIRAAAIYDAQGQIFASYVRRDAKQTLPIRPEVDTTRIDGQALLVFREIAADGEKLGTIFLSADYEFKQRLLAYAGIAALVTAFSMLIAYLLSNRLQRVVTEPIQAIASISREVVEQRDYSRRAQKLSDDEVGSLVEAFNNMLAEIERRTQELENSNQEIAREIAERRLVQQEVMRLNMDLEVRVLDRTAELEAANTELEQARITAEKANQAKSAFLSSMSHELRTPLNAVMGFTQLLMVRPESLTPQRIEEYSGHIMKAGEHLLVLINEVLDLAKVESGTLSLSMEPVSVDSVLDECHELMAPLAEHREINLAFPTNDCSHVIADRTRLKQVLLNLLSNAIKYNRVGGTVTVRCTEVENAIQISIRDTGIGLNDEQLSQLFQPFNRLGQESSTTEGTGIGLVVTKRLVELMGGSIQVTSKVGEGSEFRIKLQMFTGQHESVGAELATQGMAATVERSGRPQKTVLYVEDNPVNLKLVQEVVSFRSDLRMLTATDGILGIEIARAHRPDVILLDINLPGIDGNQALKILQQDERTRSIPVIALTANAMAKDIERGLAAGFFRYITKPIKIHELLDALDQALQMETFSTER